MAALRACRQVRLPRVAAVATPAGVKTWGAFFCVRGRLAPVSRPASLNASAWGRSTCRSVDRWRRTAQMGEDLGGGALVIVDAEALPDKEADLGGAPRTPLARGPFGVFEQRG